MKKTKVHTIKIRDIELEYSVDYRKVKYTRYELKNGKLFLLSSKGTVLTEFKTESNAKIRYIH